MNQAADCHYIPCTECMACRGKKNQAHRNVLSTDINYTTTAKTTFIIQHTAAEMYNNGVNATVQHLHKKTNGIHSQSYIWRKHFSFICGTEGVEEHNVCMSCWRKHHWYITFPKSTF